ncbi:hypothetical protein BU26DRAFT_404320, partial [Trematosphaeria pertusa]
SDTVSETSTLEYEQEAFETFKYKVMALLLEIYPSRKAEDIVIERMKGGGFNRVIGITLYPLQQKKSFFSSKRLHTFLPKRFVARQTHERKNGEQFVLRTPRFHPIGMDYHVATLEYARRCVPYPVPSVIAYDMTEGNALGKGYMIQRRLPGQSLEDLWPSLNFLQKKSAVRELINILFSLQGVTNRAAGIASRSNLPLDLDNGIVKLDTFAIPQLGATNPKFQKPNTAPSSQQTTKEFLVSMCNRWKEYEHAIYKNFFQDEIWDGFIRMTEQLDELGFLPDDEPFYLSHLDFQLRNLLAEITNESHITISGILDWDSAAFVPKFVSYRAPFFLWNDEDFSEHDESAALTIPSDVEKHAFKDVFESMVGPEFLKYAYGQEYILARRMFHVLQSGVSSNWEIDSAKEIIAQFEKLHP